MRIEIKRIYLSLVFPGLFVLAIWLVFFITRLMEFDGYTLGILPRTLIGLKGVFFSPLIHADFKHLLANTVPLIVMGTTLFYFYKDLGYPVFFLCWIITGIMVWFAGRSSYHIGASGLIYGLAGFLTLSGFIRKHIGLIAISLLVVFQYGSMIYGIFPIEEKISWESHLFGLLQGMFWAWIFRKKGPQGRPLFWRDSQKPVVDDETTDLPWDEYEIEGEKPRQNSMKNAHIVPPEWTTNITDNEPFN